MLSAIALAAKEGVLVMVVVEEGEFAVPGDTVAVVVGVCCWWRRKQLIILVVCCYRRCEISHHFFIFVAMFGSLLLLNCLVFNCLLLLPMQFVFSILLVLFVVSFSLMFDTT